MRPYELIAKKRDGGTHDATEIRALVTAVVDGSMPDYQVSAWLMAAFLNGLSEEETLALTLAMRDSGDVVHWKGVPGIKLDKHSSGGVGDKTSLVVVPLLAAAGVSMLKMSGRGLGFSGGTIDKLESIPGFKTDLSIDSAIAQVRQIGAVMVGQSPHLVPADKKLYALRDVTTTIESIPLIAASIMSKKLATGADAILLDVKVGGGAFMKTLERGRELAQTMVRIGSRAGVKTVAVLTAMDEPLGYSVGNALEVAEACSLLTGQGRVDERFRELCLELSAKGLVLAQKARTVDEARVTVKRILQSGEGAAKFEEIVRAQGGDASVVRDTSRLPRAKDIVQVSSAADGFVGSIVAERIGHLVVEIGGGRVKKEDDIDPMVGIILCKKTGDPVTKGDILAKVHLSDRSHETAIKDSVLAAFALSPNPPAPQHIIYEFIES
jgi:pyrimidine-nucleoside phosphorylase